MDTNRYQELFRKIIKSRFGIDVKFETIENGLTRIRNGAALSYKDLELIANEKLWPFKKYWMWPCQKQIKNELKATAGKLIEPVPIKNQEAREKELIRCLLAIFRNLSLVSIVLRFVWPEYYAIYSRPNLWILRIERGPSDVEEYMNYIRVMRMLKTTFRVERTADVDIIVWAIAKNSTEHKEFIKLLADQLYENLTPQDLIDSLSDDPLRIAQIYYKKSDHKTSGFWASRAFEIYLNNEFDRIAGRGRSDMNKGDLKNIIDQLCEHREYYDCRHFLHSLRKLRNRAIHPDLLFYEADAKSLIEGTMKFKQKIKNAFG